MKKGVVLILLLLSMCVLAACGKQRDDKTNVENTDSTEDSEVSDGTIVEGDSGKDFKKEVDDYEAYFFEYVDAMKLMLAAREKGDTNEMFAIDEEYDEIFDAYPSAMGDYMDIIDRDLTEDEEAYWQAASKRITEKLKEIAEKTE